MQDHSAALRARQEGATPGATCDRFTRVMVRTLRTSAPLAGRDDTQMASVRFVNFVGFETGSRARRLSSEMIRKDSARGHPRI